MKCEGKGALLSLNPSLSPYLILLFDHSHELVHHLIGDEVDVLSTFHCADTVDETDLLELPIRHSHTDLPAIIDLLKCHRRLETLVELEIL